MSATFVDDRLLAAEDDGEGDGERERTTEARCGTTTPMEALRSYLERFSSSALWMLKRGSPRGADIGELGAEEGCVAYLDCARFREKMADGFGTVSRCGDSRSPPPPNLEGERCLAALKGLGDSLEGVVAGGVSLGGVGLLVGNAILMGDLERETDDAFAGDSDLPAADLGGSPNRESPPPPPVPPPSLAPCVRLPDLDLDEASEAALVAPRCTEVTYLTPWLIFSAVTPQSQLICTIYPRTSPAVLCERASTSFCICQIPVKKMQRVAMTTMTSAAAAGTILPLPFH